MECVFVVLVRIIKTRNVLELESPAAGCWVMWSEWSEGVNKVSQYSENASSNLLLLNLMCAHINFH